MAAVSHVFTLARVAGILGEDEDWLHEICIEMNPEDGLLWVCGIGGEETPAFTKTGIENLRELIEVARSSRPSLMRRC